MQVTWNSTTRRLTITGKWGKGNRHAPRLWTVALKLSTDAVREDISFRPSQKLTLTDLEPLIGEHMDEFERKHGEVTVASWIAHAR